MARQPVARPGKSASLVSNTIPYLSVVIVNFCQWHGTTALVRSLLRSHAGRRGRAEVVIVDNGSPRHPLLRRLRRLPAVSLRRWGRNRGFSRAVNEGVRLSRGRWVLFLNPDVSVSNGFVDGVLELCKQLDRESPQIGVVGLQLRNGDGSPQGSCGAFPTLLSTLGGLLRPRGRRKYLAVSSGERQAVDWVTGCCFLVRRECLEAVGGFDAAYFLYYEDVDLCRRARSNGWQVRYEPSLQVTHHHPLHTRPVSSYLRVLTRHALLTYASRHWPRWQARVLAGIVRMEGWGRQVRARLAGDAEAAANHRELAQMAAEIMRGQRRAARRRLLQLIRINRVRAEADSQRLDLVCRETSSLDRQPVNRDPQPQPAGPADVLLAECGPTRSEGDGDSGRR